MNIAILNHMLTGGAGIAAHRLHAGLLKQGCNSTLINSNSTIAGQEIHKAHPLNGPLLSRLATGVENLLGISMPFSRAIAPILTTANCELFSDCRSPIRQLKPFIDHADIINLHWVNGLIHLPEFLQEFGGRTPLVWTLHDMNPFTGGCHYSLGCQKFSSACANCPQLANPGKTDRAHSIFSEKRESLQRLADNDLHIVVLCDWMQQNVAKSKLLGRFPCTVIPNGIDEAQFFPVDPKIARAALDLPIDKKVILFVAENLQNPRKGFDYLTKSISELNNIRQDLLFCCIGQGETQPIENLHVFGKVANPTMMRLVYSAADLFVIPSIEDNLPNTIVEALSCGTPVAGFDVGGIPEMIDVEQTGWISRQITPQGLTTTITQALESQIIKSGDIRQNCREAVLDRFSQKKQAESYRQLFECILGNFDSK